MKTGAENNLPCLLEMCLIGDKVLSDLTLLFSKPICHVQLKVLKASLLLLLFLCLCSFYKEQPRSIEESSKLECFSNWGIPWKLSDPSSINFFQMLANPVVF